MATVRTPRSPHQSGDSWLIQPADGSISEVITVHGNLTADDIL